MELKQIFTSVLVKVVDIYTNAVSHCYLCRIILSEFKQYKQQQKQQQQQQILHLTSISNEPEANV